MQLGLDEVFANTLPEYSRIADSSSDHDCYPKCLLEGWIGDIVEGNECLPRGFPWEALVVFKDVA